MALDDILDMLESSQIGQAEDLMHSEWNQSDPATLFYRIIRNGEVPLLSLLESLKLCSGREEFVFCSNAFHELLIKQVPIANEMYMYLLRKFACYGLSHFCGNLNAMQINVANRKWTDSIDLLTGWIDSLRKRKQWFDYLGADCEVVFSFRMIHNELFYIKDHKALKMLPLKEVIFCLAIFVASANNCSGDFLFKTIINQRNLIQILEVVSRELIMAKVHKKCTTKRHVVKKLVKTYRKLKQIRSVMKLVQNVPAKVDEFTEKDFKRASAPTTIAALKRFVQIFGEVIKNTLDSPNFPKKLNKILKNLFRDSLRLNSKFRDLSSHGYPLKNLYTSEFEEVFYYRHMKQYMMVIAISSLIFSVFIFHDCILHFFGIMRRTSSIEELRALIRYGGNHKMHNNQKMAIRGIFRYLEYLKYILEENEYSNEDFMAGSYESYQRKLEAVKTLDKMQKDTEHIMHTVQIAAFASASVKSIHAMLDFQLHTFSSKDLFEEIASKWLADKSFESIDFYTETAINMQNYIHQRIELDHTYAEHWLNHEETNKILSYFTRNFTVSDSALAKLKTQLHKNLNTGYYQNVFGLDSKAQAITKSLKEHFAGRKDSAEFRTQNKRLKLIIEKIRREDEIVLEKEFENIKQNMRGVFIENNCGNFSGFCENYMKMPLKCRLALEYWQIQLMEILITTKYFGDTFCTIKRSLPMIWGKTYRNYLAHDSMSYDLLTVSDASRSLVNGFVLAFDSNGLKMFSKAKDFDLEGFTILEEKGFKWIGMQMLLLQAYRKNDINEINKCLQMRADSWGRFNDAPGRFFIHRTYSIAEILAHWQFHQGQIYPAAVALSRRDPIFSRIINGSDIRKCLLLNLEQFEILDITSAIEEFKTLQPELIAPCMGAVLKYLAEKSNFNTIAYLLTSYGEYTEKIINVCLGYSMNDEPICNPLITMDNSHLDDFFESRRNTAFSAENLLFIVKTNNLEALRKAVQYGKNVIPTETFKEVLNNSICEGRLEMVKIILENGIECRSGLIVAVHHHRWKIVEYFLDNGSDPWADDGLLIFISLHERNYKLVRSIVRKSFPKEFHSKVIQYIIRQGSLKLVSFIMKRVGGLWHCDGTVGCALKNSDPKLIEFLFQEMFKYSSFCSHNLELDRWMKILNELRILEFLKSEPTVVRTAIESNLEAAEWLTEQISSFFWINKYGSIMGDSLGKNEQLERIKLCTALMDQIEHLSKELQKKSASLNVKFTNCDMKTTALVELEVFSTRPIPKLSEDIQIDLPASDLLSNSMLLSLRNLLLSHTEIVLANSFISVIKGSSSLQCFQMIHSEYSSCIIERENNYREKFNPIMMPSFDVLDILPVNASINFLRNLFALGADPLTMRSTNRNVFHDILFENRSLEHIELIYQHCLKANRSHLPNGVHVFNLNDIDGFTPLVYAVRCNNINAVAYLLQNCANPMVADRSGEAGILYDAVLNQNMEMLLLLLNHSPQIVNKPTNTERNESVLEQAVKINQFRMVKLLLEHGANLNHRNGNGMTAVGVAICNQAVESLKVILDFADTSGKSIEDVVNKNGQSALELAEKENDPEIIHLLINRTLHV